MRTPQEIIEDRKIMAEKCRKQAKSLFHNYVSQAVFNEFKEDMGFVVVQKKSAYSGEHVNRDVQDEVLKECANFGWEVRDHENGWLFLANYLTPEQKAKAVEESEKDE